MQTNSVKGSTDGDLLGVPCHLCGKRPADVAIAPESLGIEWYCDRCLNWLQAETDSLVPDHEVLFRYRRN